MAVADDDEAVRVALYPKYLNNSERLSEERLAGPFMHASKERLSYGASVGARSLLPEVEDVHRFGFLTSLAANINFEAKAGRPPSRGKESAHYVGFYQVAIKDIKAIQLSGFEVAVESAPENDRPAHCHVLLNLLDGSLSNGRRDAAATKFGIELFHKLKGPVRHVCPEDDDIRGELEARSEELPDLPYDGTDLIAGPQ